MIEINEKTGLYEIEITEICPVPNVDLGTVPGSEYVRLAIEMAEWREEALGREIKRLIVAGELPVDVDRFSVMRKAEYS